MFPMIPLHINATDPVDASTLGGGNWLQYIPMDITIVAVTGRPMEDDTGATFDIQDDTVDIITAIDVSDADVPGTWLSTHVGGSQTPVHVAAGSELELDFNNAAAENRFDITIWFLPGTVNA